MRNTGTTKERRTRALDVLDNGPWPCAAVWMIFHDRHTDLAQINAVRALEGLRRVGRVELAHDPADGSLLYRLAGRLFDEPAPEVPRKWVLMEPRGLYVARSDLRMLYTDELRDARVFDTEAAARRDDGRFHGEPVPVLASLVNDLARLTQRDAHDRTSA